MKAIIFDIDGTLANVGHRLHHVTGERKDYDAFNDAMVYDTPREWVCWLANLIADSYGSDPALFICSGRPETHRTQTVHWLKEHVPTLFGGAKALLMRPAGDYRSDVEIKREMLSNIRNQGYDVVLTVDDRQSIVDMWRREGITCLQCDAWQERKKHAPGHLILMVGPSGAGKSTYCDRTFFPGEVVSSDGLREQLTGDFRNQDHNDQVFDALHAIVEARIKCGLRTVVDATNLKARHRRAILNRVAPDCEISYYIVDRPLQDKLETQEYRSEVKVRGKPLVVAHDESFKSSLKHILKGDGDPRVTVVDLR